ncbi:mannose-1-phosphate guanylyltransferase/mannose-6-phosphate isomerase [Legionella fairfieldensis]|uniref:mannose-1-phosphate guanylyltransferase/mannose-6-phosphate isomerase n=1 Tax=Legionella fairfieldensis TaxID=45064 RepID=UPI00048B0FDC|nr:mannose-1-phosphate guanylyltransferase/mannose-6-phosphate isomerase [Legionella fairfieldensis]
MFPLTVIILCGGAGSRLWPVSREQHPKPFIRLADGQSLLQKAFLRGISLPDVQETMIVTNREFFFKIEEEISEVNPNNKKVSFIIEPFGRNTAAAIASAVLQTIKTHGDNTMMLILAADHLISNQNAFQQAVTEAIKLAQSQKLVTFGISPESPHTGYGYIEAEGNQVLRFVEKPALEKAKDYVASGRFLWNSGMFLFSAGTMLQEMEAHCPDILTAVQTCFQQSQALKNEHPGLELDSRTFALVPENSIDYTVMEKSSQVAVVPCQIGWSDIGSWNALDELIESDAKGNRVEGEILLHDVANCYIKSDSRLVGAVGLDNLLIIDTADALLVADKSRAQDVKYIYTQLKEQGHEAHKLHRTVYRPWGTFTILEDNQRYKIKRIEVKPGASLSLQMHHHRSEHWIVVSGMAKVVNGDEAFYVRTNESTYIPAGCKHRLENPGVLPLIMIEVQSGDYLGEDDIVRFEDNYGRL